MRAVIVVLLMMSIVLSGCGSNCVTGKVLSKSELDGHYYLELAIEDNLIFTGETRNVEVEQGFYFFSGVNHLVTVCD